MSSTFQRLPRTIIPLHYDIFIQPNWNDPDREPLSYICNTRIQLQINDGSTTQILLNSIGASLESVSFVGADCRSLQPLTLDQTPSDVENELLRLTFGECLSEGNGLLSLRFSVQFCDVAGLGMKGFYRSKFTATDGSTRHNYLTFFAPTYARNAFPCVDEPNFKTTFDISVVVPKEGIVAVSNMPLKSEEPHRDNGDWVVKKFERSPKMSTYLASWMIGEFDYLEDTSARVPCRVFTPLGKKKQGEFALQVATQAIKFFDEYFAIPYPLPKLDLAAFGDFPCGAMENWGLITFREMVLLVDEKESSFRTRLTVGMIISHEIAHSWFGNLVTMKWWTDLWLNEGFATFMQVMCYDSIMVELNMWDDFQATMASSARKLDSLNSSHPIEVTVKSPSDIDEIFDDISYKKGASIIAMLHDWIGDSAFRSGMSKYLTKYSYTNAETANLWAELEEASLKPVAKVMGTWTKQMGYPVINISNVRVDIDKQQVRSTISGRLFRLEQGIEKIDSSESKWFVPLTFASYSPNGALSSSGDRLVEILDGGEEQEIIFPLSNANCSCIKLNRLGVGFYRVLYSDKPVFDELAQLVKVKVLPSQDRMNLLDDLHAATVSGESSTKKLVDFLSYYKEENNYFVWCRVVEVLDELMQLFADQKEKLEELKTLGRELFSQTADRLGWDAKPSDSNLDILLRSLAIRKMVEFESPSHLSEGKRRFKEFEQSGYKISILADLRVAVYKATLFETEGETLDRLLKVYRKTDLLEEKLRILLSFQAVKDQLVQEFILQFSISGEVRMQDAVSVMIAVSNSNAVGRILTWDFFKTNWQLFQKQFTGLFIIGNLVSGITENFSSQKMEQEIESFFQDHIFRGTKMSVLQALESIRIKRAWIDRINGEK